MYWTTLRFGKHKGKTIPQILFSDPDWFFWAMEKGVFNNKGEKICQEAQDVCHKAKNIRIPQKGPERLVAEYAIHPSSGSFSDMELVPVSRPSHVGSTPTFRASKIDLSVTREIGQYDKLGCKLMISNLKHYLFDNDRCRMTKDRCEDFFEDDNNFDL